MEARYGRLGPGTRADIVNLSDDLDVESVWIGGEKVFARTSTEAMRAAQTANAEAAGI